MKYPILCCLMTATILSGCASPSLERADRLDINPPVLGGGDILRHGAEPPASSRAVSLPVAGRSGDTEMSRIRSDALMEAATSFGARMGYARRAWEIAGRLESRSSDLSTVFDFSRVVSHAPGGAGVIIPPVVSRSFNAFVTDAEGREASVADEYLVIVRAGRIAPLEPTWRDFLLFAAPMPEEPPRALLPADREEEAFFRTRFDDGWNEGVRLADAELQSRLDRLQRDYLGMLQYRRLVAQGMMDRLVLADADFGVTVDGDEMRIGSRTVRIVSDAQFQGNPTRWSIRAVTARDALIVETGEFPPLSSQLF